MNPPVEEWIDFNSNSVARHLLFVENCESVIAIGKQQTPEEIRTKHLKAAVSAIRDEIYWREVQITDRHL